MDYKIYMCVICGFIYDESKGWPDDDIAPGTRWEDAGRDGQPSEARFSRH